MPTLQAFFSKQEYSFVWIFFGLFHSYLTLMYVDGNVCRSSALPSHSRHPHQQRIVPVLLFSCSSPGLAPVLLIMSDSFRLTDFTSALLPSHHDHHHLSFRWKAKLLRVLSPDHMYTKMIWFSFLCLPLSFHNFHPRLCKNMKIL